MGTNKKLIQDDFIERSSLIHNNKYNYDKAVYQSAFVKVIITCPIHGDFEQIASNHLRGSGCADCSGNKVKTTEQFVKDANEKHNGQYLYNKVEYKTARKKVIITCPVHGDFEQTPTDHLSGYGCAACSTYGFSYEKDAVLYVHKVFYNEELIGYKVGITNRSVDERLRELNRNNSAKFECIMRFYSDGQTVYDLETAIHKKCQMVHGLKDIIPDGYTEIIHTDDLLIAFDMLSEALKH